jgi:hypothetical protein
MNAAQIAKRQPPVQRNISTTFGNEMDEFVKAMGTSRLHEETRLSLIGNMVRQIQALLGRPYHTYSDTFFKYSSN